MVSLMCGHDSVSSQEHKCMGGLETFLLIPGLQTPSRVSLPVTPGNYSGCMYVQALVSRVWSRGCGPQGCGLQGLVPRAVVSRVLVSRVWSPRLWSPGLWSPGCGLQGWGLQGSGLQGVISRKPHSSPPSSCRYVSYHC